MCPAEDRKVKKGKGKEATETFKGQKGKQGKEKVANMPY